MSVLFIPKAVKAAFDPRRKIDEDAPITLIVLKNGIEFLFRVVGFFIVTCLILGLTLTACSESWALQALPLVMVFSLFLYLAIMTLGLPFFYLVASIRHRLTRWVLRGVLIATILAATLFSVTYSPIIEILETYIYRLFPNAPKCRDGLVTIGKDAPWIRLDEQTIMLQGDINAGNYQAFREVFDHNTTKVIVDSKGGDTYEGVRIGLDLLAADVDVFVNGYCLSSCANYIFLAGRRKVIEDGIVGFHGNTQTIEDNGQGPDSIPLLHRLTLNMDAVKKSFQTTLRLESRFLRQAGVSQELFDVSYQLDKGAGNGREYEFLLPSRETFEKYGVTGVEGDHRILLIEQMIAKANADGFEGFQVRVESSR